MDNMNGPDFSTPKSDWNFFAAHAGALGSDLYAELSEHISRDQEVKALAAQAQPGQPHPNLLFGAVHFLILRGARHPFRDFCATVGGSKRNNPYPAFRDFVHSHRAALAGLIATRVTNTNEVQRSAILHAGFAAIAQHTDHPLFAIEIGPSAGLNLNWHLYGVRYLRNGAVRAQVSPGAALVLDCDLRSADAPPVGRLPFLAGRLGLERAPVDLADPDQRDWLRALIWADQPARLARLDRAIALFDRDAAPILGGDALDLLPGALAGVPADAVPVVYHTLAVYQFDAAMTARLEAILAGAGRPLFRLACEYDGVLLLSAYGGGPVRTQRLGLAHPHGTWLEWQALSTGPALL